MKLPTLDGSFVQGKLEATDTECRKGTLFILFRKQPPPNLLALLYVGFRQKKIPEWNGMINQNFRSLNLNNYLL